MGWLKFLWLIHIRFQQPVAKFSGRRSELFFFIFAIIGALRSGRNPEKNAKIVTL
jgi:hypothetical protein